MAALFHISWILVQKDALQILTCWCSSVAWLILVSHVILLGNVDQQLSLCYQILSVNQNRFCLFFVDVPKVLYSSIIQMLFMVPSSM